MNGIPQTCPEDSARPAMGVLFRLGERLYAVPIECVGRVFRMAAWTAVPEAPESVLGVIDVGGRIVPVLDLRRRLGVAPRKPSLDHRLILLNVDGWRFFLPVDAVEGLVDLAGAEPPPEPVPVGHPVRRVLGGGDGLVLVLEPAELDRARWAPSAGEPRRRGRERRRPAGVPDGSNHPAGEVEAGAR